MAVVARQPGDSEIAFLSGDGHLLVRTRVGSGEEAKALHEWVETNSLSPDSITRVVRPDRIITSSVLNDALNSVHVYSQEVGQQQVRIDGCCLFGQPIEPRPLNCRHDASAPLAQ